MRQHKPQMDEREYMRSLILHVVCKVDEVSATRTVADVRPFMVFFDRAAVESFVCGPYHVGAQRFVVCVVNGLLESKGVEVVDENCQELAGMDLEPDLHAQLVADGRFVRLTGEVISGVLQSLRSRCATFNKVG